MSDPVRPRGFAFDLGRTCVPGLDFSQFRPIPLVVLFVSTPAGFGSCRGRRREEGLSKRSAFPFIGHFHCTILPFNVGNLFNPRILCV